MLKGQFNLAPIIKVVMFLVALSIMVFIVWRMSLSPTLKVKDNAIWLLPAGWLFLFREIKNRHKGFSPAMLAVTVLVAFAVIFLLFLIFKGVVKVPWITNLLTMMPF